MGAYPPYDKKRCSSFTLIERRMITSIRLVSLRRSRPNEFVAQMAVVGEGRDEDPGRYAGERVRERFGRNERHGRMLRNEDILPSVASQLGGQAARTVARNMALGREGIFTVGRDGKFRDYHGMWVRVDYARQIFTPAALARGIGTYFVQTYYHERRALARFKVVRIFRCDRRGRIRLTVRKRKFR